MPKKNDLLIQLGFKPEHGGAHSARTMMYRELKTLLDYVSNPKARKLDYLSAITRENCLGKRSAKTRTLTFRHMVALYSLDCKFILFRALRFFGNRDTAGLPLLALFCAYARDPVFRATAPLILNWPEGTLIQQETLEKFIEGQEPGRFSTATLKSMVRNINSTWTQAGHLQGRTRKVRAHAKPSAGSVSYAMLLGYLTGARGQLLFQTEYAKLLDCTMDKAIELAEEASRRGWIVFKRVDNVMEVLFPNLITQEEMEWLREQN